MEYFGIQRLMAMCHPLIFLILTILFHRYMYKEQPLCSEYASQILCSSHRGVYTHVHRPVPQFRLKCTILAFRGLWPCVIPWFSWFYLSYCIAICIRNNHYVVTMRHKFFIVGLWGYIHRRGPNFWLKWIYHFGLSEAYGHMPSPDSLDFIYFIP